MPSSPSDFVSDCLVLHSLTSRSAEALNFANSSIYIIAKRRICPTVSAPRGPSRPPSIPSIPFASQSLRAGSRRDEATIRCNEVNSVYVSVYRLIRGGDKTCGEAKRRVRSESASFGFSKMGG